MLAKPATSQFALADVLVVTALREERDAVKAVCTGALGDSWVSEEAPNTGLRIERRSFRAKDGGDLHVALICAEDMGGTQTAGVAGSVLMTLRPRCMAMCGVLAGRPNDTELGDVIFADQLFMHDSGKRKETGFEHATRPHTLNIRWLEKARDFAMDPGDALEWLDKKEWTEDQQRDWLLDQFSRGRNRETLDRLLKECCPLYERIIGKLLDEELVQLEDTPLTEKGKRHVREQRYRSLRWPGLDSPRRALQVHVGPIASGNAVQADPELWSELALFARKTLGVEMEAHAIGNTAELYQVELALVMKGVMDHADTYKDDRYKTFAARGSAECLLAFLRRYLPTRLRLDYDDILSPGTAPLPDNPSPSRLLMPTYEVVKFYRPGRTTELTELEAWCMSGRDVRGRLIHGPGGYGKTRLAIQWTRELRERGWSAGFLRSGVANDWFARLMTLGKPTAIVIDYAESHTGLLNLLDPVIRYASVDGNKTRVRVLLLARAAGDWWDSLIAREESLRSFLTEISPEQLEPLVETASSRIEAFQEAVSAFSSFRKRPPIGKMPADLTDLMFERIVYLHMAALAMVDGLRFRTPALATEEDLIDALLDHEERFWDERQGQDDRRRRTQIGQVRQIVAAATLRGGFPSRDAAQMVTLSVLGESHEHLVMLAHDVYGLSSLYIGPLEPDLLGEGMVRRVFDRSNERSGNFIDRVFEDDQADAVLHGFIVLGRSSAGVGARIRPWIDRFLSTKLEERALLAFVASMAVGKHTAISELGESLAEALRRGGDAKIAEAIDLVGIPEKTVVLLHLAEWVYTTLLSALSGDAGETTLQERANLLGKLSNAQSAAGQREAALASAEEVLRIYEGLATRFPDSYLPHLASSLNNLGKMQSALGQRDAALRSVTEATRVYEAMVSSHPSKGLRFKATSLSNTSTMQILMGQREAALESATEAVHIFRKLTEMRPDEFLPDLAVILINLGNAQSASGMWKAALESTLEAVCIRRELAKKNPDAFQPYLASTLNNLGMSQSEVGQHTEALESIGEAVRIHWELAKKHPTAFRPDLAASLHNLGKMQRALGEHDKALESTGEAVRIRKELTKRNPSVFLPDLAMSLKNLCILQSEVGQKEAALESAKAAFQIYSELAKVNPDAFRPDLASSLDSLGAMQAYMGLREASLKSVSEAVRIYRELDHNAFLPRLAASLINLGAAQSKLKLWQAAIDSSEEAAIILSRLADDYPDVFLPHLATSLTNLGMMQRAVGQPEAALESLQEAFDIYWDLCRNQPRAFISNLTVVVQRLLDCLMEVGGEIDEPLDQCIELLQKSDIPIDWSRWSIVRQPF